MTEHKRIYQAMFLLDNEEVRKGFNTARDWVQTTLEKHGLEVKVLRLWGERQLAYTIAKRRRATYLLAWLEGSGNAVNEVKRELYLLGPVFRCLFLQEEAIPDEELAHGIQKLDDSEVIIPEEIEEVAHEEVHTEPAAESKTEEQAPAKTEEQAPAKTEESSEEKLEEVKTDGN